MERVTSPTGRAKKTDSLVVPSVTEKKSMASQTHAWRISYCHAEE